MRQEAMPPLDEISEIAPGIRRLQLPISLPGLGHVNCYLLEDERGFALVDPGLPGEEPWDALMTGLRRAGAPLKRIHSVIVTHSHPDHFGGAAQLRDEAGADIVSHRTFRIPWAPAWDDQADTEPDQLAADDPTGRPLDQGRPGDMYGRPTPWGTPFLPVSLEQRERNLQMWKGRALPRPTVKLDDADTIMLAGRPWVALHTPGHTLDHLCLYDPEYGILLSGDHVLPTITPHIGGLTEDGDPLDQYFSSLHRVAALPGSKLVLPAHGLHFGGLSDRVDGIIEHHLGRLQRLVDASNELGRPGTVVDYMRFLFKERSWGSMAESETYAHLEHLRIAGCATVERVNGELEFVVERVDPAAGSAGA
jgi:glyoxylase-like metal-dependent hydrolase (beta-lactamase superfamily II)